LSSEGGTKLLPSIIVDGPTFQNYNGLDKFYIDLQMAWAHFNGIPFLNANTQKNRIEDFKSFRCLQEKQRERIPRCLFRKSCASTFRSGQGVKWGHG
jgi:hypothetical protein